MYIIDDIRPMPSSCRDFQKEKADPPGNAGFLKDLWEEFFGARV